MKILHVLYSGLGGHGNVFFSLIDADKEKQFEYEALFYGIEDVRDEYITKCKQKGIKWYFAKKKHSFDLLFFKKIWEYILKSSPDIVFLHGSGYIILAKIFQVLYRRKTQIIVRETQANHLKTPFQKICLFFSLLFANKVVFLTKQFMDEVRESFSLIFNKSKMVIIPNGIDQQIFKPGDKKSSNFVYIGMQSRLIKIKDHLTLIKAFAALKSDFSNNNNIKLLIAGEGDFKSVIIEEVEKLNIKDDVVFTGMLEEKELVSFLQSLSIYVHASFGETMSTAIMQAMSCGLPIIASNVNGINNMINDSVNGVLVPLMDSDKLYEAMLMCLTKPEISYKIASNSYRTALEKYSNNLMFKKYKDLFTSVN